MAKLKTFDLFDNEPATEKTEEDSRVVESTPQTILGAKVSNIFPTITASYRLAIIGEAPGADEEYLGQPFVGASGRYLDTLLSKVGILRNACFIGNVCQHRPPKNDISLFAKDSKPIVDGLAQLHLDLQQFNPNLCLLLGKTALWAAKGVYQISDWRGSLFMATSDNFITGKCLATFHPAHVLRSYEWTPIVLSDLRRAHKEAHAPTLTPPTRRLHHRIDFSDLITNLDRVQNSRGKWACDIEGGVASVSCLSFSDSSAYSFIVPLAKLDGSSYWTEDEEYEIWYRLARIFADPSITKIWQNGLYDRFVLQWTHSILVRSSDDIMLKFWEAYCELEKSLAFQASILTEEPYYKFQRKSTDQDTFYRYCCTDSALTKEIDEKITKILTPAQTKHYTFNDELLDPLLYMESRGILYNEPLAKARLADVESHQYTYQSALDDIARSLGALSTINFDVPKHEIVAQVNSICGYKKDPSKPKKTFVDDGYYPIMAELQRSSELSPALRGRIASLCGCTMNTKSHKKFQDFLYGTCSLPIQWKKDLKTKELRPTTDYESLLRLSKSHNHPALHLALDLSLCRTRAQMLRLVPHRGRMHCSYILVGSETGRVTSRKSVLYTEGKQVGGNMQTVPDEWEVFPEDHPVRQGMRDLFLADEDCYLAKCDLKGADGWTIGAYMTMLGDSTMLDDLKFGVKPAQVCAYILIKGEASYLRLRNDRAALHATVSTEVKKEMWEYFVSKIGIWGTFYTMGPRALANNIFIQSNGKVNLSESEVRDFQRCILVRYNAPLWQNWMQRQIQAHPYPFQLTASNGFTRKFFDRKSEVLGEALAHLPQVYTTYATLLAARRLWYDPTNRLDHTHGCRLRVEPLHQVHDELLVQFRRTDVDWAKTKIREWFNNPILIANATITIPYDGAYGPDWGMSEETKVGNI